MSAVNPSMISTKIDSHKHKYMRLSDIILEFAGPFHIVPWDEMSDEYDPWVAAEQADIIANKSRIRIGRNKELEYIALNAAGDVIGAVWSSLDRDGDSYAYDFDVAVDPSHRSPIAQVGLRLIDAALESYRAHTSEHEKVYVRVYVVNPKLIRVLERKYGFEVEELYQHGAAHMVYHGN